MALLLLDQTLTPDYHPDYWSDDRVIEASRLLKELDDAEWAELGALWRQRPAHWQAQLADAIFGIERPEVAALLSQMVVEGEPRAALAAALTLESRDDHLENAPALRAALERLRDQTEQGFPALIQGLIDRLAPAG